MRPALRRDWSAVLDAYDGERHDVRHVNGHGVAPDPDEDLDARLAAEEAAGSRDPYRAVAPPLHVVGRRV